MNDLSLRPIVSNIITASYETVKYLAKFLFPLAEPKSSNDSSKQFANYIKNQEVPDGYQMVSFDVTSHLQVCHSDTSDISLRRIYIDMEIGTIIRKREMKDYTFVQKMCILVLTVRLTYRLML